jgi:hypothetical protein
MICQERTEVSNPYKIYTVYLYLQEQSEQKNYLGFQNREEWILKWSAPFRSSTTWSVLVLEKPQIAQLLKNASAFYGTQRF